MNSDRPEARTLRERIPEKYVRIGLALGAVLIIVGYLGAAGMVVTGDSEGEPVWKSKWDPENEGLSEPETDFGYESWMPLMAVAIVGTLMTALMLELDDNDQ